MPFGILLFRPAARRSRAGVLARVTAAGCLAALLLAGPAAACPRPAGAQQSGQLAERVFTKASPSIVVVIAKNAAGQATLQGSGVVIAPRTLVTNCHVAQGGPIVQVRSGGKNLPRRLRIRRFRPRSLRAFRSKPARAAGQHRLDK